MYSIEDNRMWTFTYEHFHSSVLTDAKPYLSKNERGQNFKMEKSGLLHSDRKSISPSVLAGRAGQSRMN